MELMTELRFENRTNKRFYVVQTGPCPRCGFGGKVNDPDEAKRRGTHSHIINCPQCGGKGEAETRVPLTEALNRLIVRHGDD